MSEEKAAFREMIRVRYRELDEKALRRNDELIVDQLLNHPLYRNAERIFLYVGINKEIHTMEMIEAAYQEGKTVALPKSESDGVMHFHRYTGVLTEGRFCIPEPVSNEVLIPRMNDLMIVPGLSFDCCGGRMGQGGGYYDRFLANLDHVTKISLAFDMQLIPKIPTDHYDIPVNYTIVDFKAVLDQPVKIFDKDGKEIYIALTEKSNILKEYIIPEYEILHTQGKEYIVNDILEVMREEGVI